MQGSKNGVSGRVEGVGVRWERIADRGDEDGAEHY